VSEDEQQERKNSLDEAGINQESNRTQNDASESLLNLPNTIETSRIQLDTVAQTVSEQTDVLLAGAGDDAELEAGQTDEDQTSLPPGFKPISEAKLKRAKRTKRILITVIILLLLVLCGCVVIGAYYYLNFVHHEPTQAQDPIVIEIEGDTIEDRGVAEPMEMPNLAQMFGMTPEEILVILGPEYAITKTDVAEPTEDEELNPEEGGELETDSVTTQVVTITYTPNEQDGTVSLRQTQRIYLTLGRQGTTIEVYFYSSMDILDFPISNFADLVNTNDSFLKTLSSAGVTVLPDDPYIAPSREEFTEFVDPNANVKRIKKETATWTGSLASEVPPTSFEITYTFDYGASGVEDSPDKYPLQRMIYLKLS